MNSFLIHYIYIFFFLKNCEKLALSVQERKKNNPDSSANCSVCAVLTVFRLQNLFRLLLTNLTERNRNNEEREITRRNGEHFYCVSVILCCFSARSFAFKINFVYNRYSYVHSFCWTKYPDRVF